MQKKKVKFTQMSSAENYFTIIENVELCGAEIREISKITHCDQLLILFPSDKANIRVEIYNKDGSEANACGNAMCCVTHYLHGKTTIETKSGIRLGELNKEVTVNMGKPRIFSDLDEDFSLFPMGMRVREIYNEISTYYNFDEYPRFVNVGNPHLLFKTENLPNDEMLRLIGRNINERKDLFPEGVNITFYNDHAGDVFAKVYERGAMITKSCGTAACAIRSVEEQDLLILFQGARSHLSVKKVHGDIFLKSTVKYHNTGMLEI